MVTQDIAESQVGQASVVILGQVFLVTPATAAYPVGLVYRGTLGYLVILVYLVTAAIQVQVSLVIQVIVVQDCLAIPDSAGSVVVDTPAYQDFLDTAVTLEA